MESVVSMLRALSAPVVVLDLEFTAWEGSHAAGWSRPGEFREIVQIGAVRLGPDLGERGWFNRLVRPVRNPRLSDYFIALTGITQQRLEAEGGRYPDVLQDFAAFVGDEAVVVLSNGSDGLVVAENCELAAVPCPIPAGRFIDVRRPLAEAQGVPVAVADSGALPRMIGLSLNHREHDALDNARSVAAALRHVAGRK